MYFFKFLKLRFIVELVNGHLKNLKALDNIRNTQLGHIAIDYRIAAAMLNFSHNPICPDKGKEKIIADRMRRKSEFRKNKLDFILSKTLDTKNIRPIEIKDIKDFPRLKKSVIRDRISLGTFQPRLGKSYIKDIIENSFAYIVENGILKEIESTKLKNGLANAKYKLIAMEILSRHCRSKKSNKNEKKTNKLNQYYTKVYKVFILYKPHINNHMGISAYICSCMSGKRTNGCCVHVATVIYFLSNVVHKDKSLIRYPGNHLNNVLVDINSNTIANSPEYLRNRRRIKDIESSSDSDNDISSDSDHYSSENEEKKPDMVEGNSGKKKNIIKAKESSSGTNKKTKEEKAGKKKKIESIPKNFLPENQLRNNAWLTDIEIWGFLSKMRDYLNLNNILFSGLNDPIVLTSLRIDGENRRNDHFVEILNSGNNHWVTVAAGLPFDRQDVCLYDSMSRNSIDVQLGTLTSLICNRSRLEKGYLIYRLQHVQTQKRNLCGYFALANAMALSMGLDPEELIFDENSLKEHFINIMFHNQSMRMFPYKQKPKLRNKKHLHLRFDLKNVTLTERLSSAKIKT